jgi:thioredoxin reductase
MVLDITEDKRVIATNSEDGIFEIQAKAIILAMGCRERAKGALNIAGTRPSGVYSAGTAQKLVNIDGYLPGKECVILGSGDIGLIMARRMTFEGAKVKACVELMPYSSGLNRNIVQCLNDFNIPLKFSHTVVDIKGEGRVSSVVIAEVDERLQPKMETCEEIKCDTLLLSVGLLPENELASGANVKLSPITGGAIVNDQMMTNIDGVFSCGNVLHVHDLVDFVSAEASHAGECAVAYLNGAKASEEVVKVNAINGIRYVVPQLINKDDNFEALGLKMRVGNVFKNVEIRVSVDGEKIFGKKKQIVTPGEMETVNLKPELVEKIKQGKEVTVELVK